MYKILLGDICTKESSNIRQSDLENHNGDYPIYGASGLIKYIDFYTQDKPYIGIVKDGAGVGRVMKLPAYSSVIGTMQYIIPNDGIDVSYLAYAMEHMNLSKYYMGAAIPHIYFKDYKHEPLPLHTKEEQKTIVSVLDRISSLISNKECQTQKLDKLVKSRFVEMFENNLFPLTKANEVCEFITKGTTPPASSIYKEYIRGRIPFIKVYNLSFTGELLFSQEPQFISNSTHDGQLKRSKVYPNDVLMNIVGPPLGKFSLVTNEYPEWNINQAIAIFRAKEKIIPQYLMAALMQPDVLCPFLEQAVGIRQQNLNLEQCRNLEIPLPPIDLQNHFADFVARVEKTKSKIKQSIEKLETLKKSLMQKYFG